MTSSHIPDPLPPKGHSLPVDDLHASFTLFGFLPFGNSHNSLNPRLVLHPNQIEIKIMQTDFYDYQTIEKVDYWPSRLFRSSQVLLKLREGTTFYVYLPTAATEKTFIQFLQARGIPVSAAAQSVMASG